MAKFPERRNHEEESSSWIYTVLGMAIILCVVGFIGLAQPSGTKSTVEYPETGLPKYQAPDQVKLEQIPVKSEPLPDTSTLAVVKSEVPPSPVELPKFPINVLQDPGLFVWLPFGGDARERCVSNCNAEALCLQSCERLLPDNFARRILPKDLDHKELAVKSVQSCTKASFLNPVVGARRAEIKTSLIPVDYFEEGEVLRKLSESAGVMQNLTNSNTSDPLAEAICYYQGSLVSSLAMAKAAKIKDSVSELAYRHYESLFVSELQRKLQEIRG